MFIDERAHMVIQKGLYRNFILHLGIVLFKSLGKCKGLNKGNFTLKSNSNKIMLCGSGGKHYLLLNKISTEQFHFLGFLLGELNNIFHVKDLKDLLFVSN